MARALIILPLFNEAATLGRVLDEVHRAAPAADVLVVDDGSTDAAPEILASRSEGRPGR